MNVIETLKNEVAKSMIVSVVNSTKTTGARFGSLKYTNENGETSRYSIIFGINIVSLYKADLRTLKSLLPKLKSEQTRLNGIKTHGEDFCGMLPVACQELINSVQESLTVGIGNNSRYTLKGYYTPITPNGEVKLHVDEAGETFLYIRGYVLNKTVLVKGEYPHVNSSPKTLAKKEIEKMLKRGKIRTFKIKMDALHVIKVNGMTLEIE